MLTIQQQATKDGVVCRPVGELDAFSVSQFRQALAETASSPNLVIDLSAVSFVDSAGLGALIGGIRRTREHGGQVAVACNRPALRGVLQSSGFDRIVLVTGTVGQATEALHQSEDRDGGHQSTGPSDPAASKRSA
jgi:anti-sigma B factor antagonist